MPLLKNVEPEWLEDEAMLGLLKNEVVITEYGVALRVLSSAGESQHPVLAHHPNLEPLMWLNYPTKVFRDRRGRR